MIALRDKAGPVRSWTHLTVHLGCNDDVVATGEIFQRTTEDFFAAAGEVAVGRVKEVDACLKRASDEGARFPRILW